jgi:hypothetical protein
MKIKIIPILLVASVVSILATSSCKKEQQANPTDAIPASDLKLATMLNNFKQRGESHLKTNSEMSPDSAIWYIGATANFTYGDASRETERTWIDSLFITLPINNGKISESEVYNKYEAVIDSLREIYQGKNEENKQLLAVTVTTHSIDATELVCKVTGVFAYGYINNNCTFNNIDSWQFGKIDGDGGICDGINAGTYFDSDAAEETQKKIMACKAVPAGNYWYDPITITKYVYPMDFPIIPNTTPSNNHFSYLYWNSEQFQLCDHGCIPPADLNFYLAKTKELIYNEDILGQVGLRPTGYSLMDIDMEGFLEQQGIYNVYLHKATVKYGILHVSIYPPNPL